MIDRIVDVLILLLLLIWFLMDRCNIYFHKGKDDGWDELGE